MTGILGVQGSDPELTVDFVIPSEASPPLLDGSYFTSTILANVTFLPSNFVTVTPANDDEFPALKGLGISCALFSFTPGAVNPPHTHPRATELLYVIRGVLDVGFIDSSNKLRTQTIKTGDLFVFPKGLVHYEVNRHHRISKALASFNSANPGLLRLPTSLFKSGIADDVLQRSFGVSSAIIHELKNATVN
ncbi:protein MpCupin62 [Marchantia polymorpha subsp. ruderalis]|nr:hypothetical protein MARPO_0193s0018 [Marchantia polymorpha]BBN10079.1 hypothetical protein Mp_5g00740 [Marchantia polymorpha subsp. ruderalis]|eukprot:PTQ27554.1 hypothetical protein MARPO_0193s0018 [Marchantia polymorpha]